MADEIGNITVPANPPSGTWPLASDFPHGRVDPPEVVEHVFDNSTANYKATQRFYLGNGAKRWTFRRTNLCHADRLALIDFWQDRSGPWQPFIYHAPNDDGSFTDYTVRFENAPLAFELLLNAVCSVGIMFIEVPDDDDAPVYTLTGPVQTRFPSGALPAALLSQVQQVIPLVKIVPRQAGYPAIYVSDRRCTVDSQLYQARLLRFEGISQGIDGSSDMAQFIFGNADEVMRLVTDDVDLWRASVEFSLLHVDTVDTGTKLDLWNGEIVEWEGEESAEFQVSASDAIDESYPRRTIDRMCQKKFADGADCPYGGAPGTCDKGFETPNGCQSHGMDPYFGGIIAKPQGVYLKASKGTSLSRFINLTSQVSDSVYGQGLPEIYTDGPMLVQCKVVAGREEDQFYDAAGVIGAGPLAALSNNPADHLLDGQAPHGPGALGLRISLGADPNPDPFGLTSTGEADPSERAAGTAFLEIRRTDPKGVQPTAIGDHTMQTVVTLGLGGWVWSDPSTRAWSATITNPVWVAVNTFLRAKRLMQATKEAQTAVFDVDAALAAASICNTLVPKMVPEGGGDETQFKFKGIIQQKKGLRDWLLDILANCLGYYVYSSGKLKIGLAIDSSVVQTFTQGNILRDSLKLAKVKPEFNSLTAVFADEEYGWQDDTVTLYDQDHIDKFGGPTPKEKNLVGVSGKSQASRIVTVKFREEVGGRIAAEWRRARSVSLRTTILALAVEPGMVCSMTHAKMPGGYGEFRVKSWRLNPDWSVDIEGKTITDSMYDMTVGPKPADVTAPPDTGEKITEPEPPDVAISDEAIENDGSLYRFKGKITFVTDTVAYWTTKGIEVCFYGPLTADGDPLPDAGPHVMGIVAAPDPGGGTVAVDWTSDSWTRPAALEHWKIQYMKISKGGARHENEPFESALLTLTPLDQTVMGAAPDPLVFKVGTANEDGSYTAVPRWDHDVKNLLFDWGVVLPGDLTNWSGLEIYVKTPDLVYIGPCTGPLKLENFVKQEDGTYARHDVIAISGEDLPAAPVEWTFIAACKNAAGTLNVDGDGHPSGLQVTLSTLTRYAAQVTGATALQGTDDYTAQKEETYYFYGEFTPPADPIWESVEIRALWAGDDPDEETMILGRFSDGAWITDSWPIGVARWLRITFCSVSTGGFVNVTAAPYVDLLVAPTVGGAGMEYAPLVIGASATRTIPIKYADSVNFNSPGGIELYGFTLNWTDPASELYSGVRIYCEYADGTRRDLTSIVRDDMSPIKTSQWPLAAAETFIIWFVSSRGDLENTIVNGVTPKVILTFTPIAPGTVKGPRVIDIPTASFAAGIKPTSIFSALPALPNPLYPPGSPAYLTSVNPPKPYRVDLTGYYWTAQVDGADLMAYSVTAAAIAAHSIGTQQLVADEILVGRGGGKPTRFRVNDQYGAMAAFLGTDDAGLYMNWFRDIRVGPNIASPVIVGDLTGLSITNATIQVTGPGGTVVINPTLGLKVSDASYATTIAAGILTVWSVPTPVQYAKVNPWEVFTESNTGNRATLESSSSGGIVRVSAGGAYRAQMCAYGAYGPYINVAGIYQVAGTTVIDSSRNARFYDLVVEAKFEPALGMSSWNPGATAAAWLPIFDVYGGYVGRIPVYTT